MLSITTQTSRTLKLLEGPSSLGPASAPARGKRAGHLPSVARRHWKAIWTIIVFTSDVGIARGPAMGFTAILPTAHSPSFTGGEAQGLVSGRTGT